MSKIVIKVGEGGSLSIIDSDIPALLGGTPASAEKAAALDSAIRTGACDMQVAVRSEGRPDIQFVVMKGLAIHPNLNFDQVAFIQEKVRESGGLPRMYEEARSHVCVYGRNFSRMLLASESPQEEYIDPSLWTERYQAKAPRRVRKAKVEKAEAVTDAPAKAKGKKAKAKAKKGKAKK